MAAGAAAAPGDSGAGDGPAAGANSRGRPAGSLSAAPPDAAPRAAATGFPAGFSAAVWAGESAPGSASGGSSGRVEFPPFDPAAIWPHPGGGTGAGPWEGVPAAVVWTKRPANASSPWAAGASIPPSPAGGEVGGRESSAAPALRPCVPRAASAAGALSSSSRRGAAVAGSALEAAATAGAESAAGNSEGVDDVPRGGSGGPVSCLSAPAGRGLRVSGGEDESLAGGAPPGIAAAADGAAAEPSGCPAGLGSRAAAGSGCAVPAASASQTDCRADSRHGCPDAFSVALPNSEASGLSCDSPDAPVWVRPGAKPGGGAGAAAGAHGVSPDVRAVRALHLDEPGCSASESGSAKGPNSARKRTARLGPVPGAVSGAGATARAVGCRHPKSCGAAS